MNLDMEQQLKDKQPLSVNAVAAGTTPTARRLTPVPTVSTPSGWELATWFALFTWQKKENCPVDIPDPEENQNQDKEKHISKNIHQAPLRKLEPGSEKHYFGNTEGLEELCRKKFTLWVGKADFCYADNTNNTSNDKLVEKFLGEGSYILGVLYKYGSSKANTSNGRVAQTLIDILEYQFPFRALFELHKLKHGNGDDVEQGNRDDVSLLEELILLVKNCFEIQVGKLTPLNADPCKCKYKPENLPKHLLELVHSLCTPTRSDEYCGGLVLQQIKTATELKNDGVSFKKNNGEHTLFDIHFKENTMKIRGFRIDDFTEAFFRSMIDYEQKPDNDAPKYFTDFVLFMSKLISTRNDAKLLCGIIDNFHGTNKVELFSELCKGVKTSSTSTFSGAIKKQEVPEENQTHNIGKYISRVPEALSITNPSAYKPKLISIGPYYRIQEPGSENSNKRYFQEGFFGNTEGLEERCQVKLTSLVDKARSCYAGSTKNISNERLVEMLMRDGCFILQFLKSVKDKKSGDNGEAAQTFMEKERNIVQTLKDMLLFENQIPFFVLFELHKLKQDKGDDAELLMELIELVKNCYESQVRKLTQPLLPCKYTPEKLPKHLLEVVHSLCVPTRSDERCTGQIHTATGLEKYGIRFNNTGELHSLFDMDINWYAMKIRCFRIDDFTETFLRNMIAYEEQSDFASKYFTDFVLFMSHLIKTPEDANLLCGTGIIDNIQNTDMVQLFKDLIVKDNTSSLSTLSTLSGVIKKARLHCDSPPNKWTGKLIQEFINNPWATIIGIGAVFAMIVGIVVGIARVF